MGDSQGNAISADDISKLSPSLTGVSGEYFVAAELSRRGYVASITLRNSRGIDILVSDENATRTLSVQVKTNKTNTPEWILNKKSELYADSSHFYVFVNLKSAVERPDFYIVPSAVVAEYTRRTHQVWLATPGRAGQEHRDSTMRKFVDRDQAYLERWDLLAP